MFLRIWYDKRENGVNSYNKKGRDGKNEEETSDYRNRYVVRCRRNSFKQSIMACEHNLCDRKR